MQKILLVLALFITTTIHAQQYKYAVDISNIVNDEVTIKGTVPNTGVINADGSITYHFPKVIPGTYAIEDYGKYIKDFKAFDKNNNALQVTKRGNNDFEITNGAAIATIQYNVEDAMDKKVRKHKIFEPASTNILKDKNVVMNNGGFFGYLTGTEKTPIELLVTKPASFLGATSLPTTATTATTQQLNASSYHHLLDNPILWAAPDTAKFYVNNTLVTIACYDENGTPHAKAFYNSLKKDMEAVAKYYPKLPVDNYTFLVYVGDFKKWGPILAGEKRPSIKDAYYIITKLSKVGIGALEHGSSSLYYLADFGSDIQQKELQLQNQLTSAAIHEFMHILTPLGLHSKEIGEFDYANPQMSKHLWLYEGCTEYQAHLIKLQGGIYTEEKFFEEMLTKQKSAAKYPWAKMSFTDMSKNVLEKKEHKQYNHVYDRGAIYAWLLDMRIIELTNGQKSLKDVLLTLNNKYGKDKSFDDAVIIQELVTEVHPDLLAFFDNHISGYVDYNMDDYLKPFGYNKVIDAKVRVPKSPLYQNNIATKTSKNIIEITKLDEPNAYGLKVGDKVKVGTYADVFKKDGKYAAEGSKVQYTYIRDGKEITIPITVAYIETTVPIAIQKKDATAPSNTLWQTFLGKK